MFRYFFEKQFNKKNEIIETIPGIIVRSCRCFLPANIKDFIGFRKFLKHSIPWKVTIFYLFKLPFVISWYFKRPDSNAIFYSGSSALAGMDELFLGPQKGGLGAAKRGNRLKYLLWYDGDNREFITKLEKDFFIFDVINIDAHCYTLIQFSRRHKSPKLFLFLYPNYIYPLTLDFKTYIRYTEKLRGTHLWQEFFINKELCDSNALKYLEDARPLYFFTAMKTIFPDVDLNAFGLTQKKEERPPSFFHLALSKNYKQRFESMFTDLKMHMHDFYVKNHLQTTLLLVRKIEYIIKRPLPDSMLAFYLSFNGFKMNWIYAESKNTPYKAANLDFLELFRVFCGYKYTDNPNSTELYKGILVFEDDDTHYEFAKKCYPIVIEEFHTTAIHFVEGKEEPELYLFIGSNPFKLSLNFSEFIERLFETRGLLYWQYQFIDKEAMPYLDLSNDFSGDIIELFPEVDLSPYRQE